MIKIKVEQYAKYIAKATLISPKENPGIKLAKKRYGSTFINKILKKKTFSDSFLNVKEKRIVKSLMDFKYGPLVYKVKNTYKVKPIIGETVLVNHTYRDKDAVKIAQIFREICWKKGCSVLLRNISDFDTKKAIELAPEWSLTEFPEISKAILKNTDVRIFIGENEDMHWSKGLDKKLKLGAPASQAAHIIADKRKTRWCFAGWPVKMTKASYVVPVSKYNRVFKDSINQTFSKKCQTLINYYYKALNGKSRVKITANDGTDLRFSIKSRIILPSRGFMTEKAIKRGDIGLNIPDGEVFCAPVETSANGKIKFDWAMPPGKGLIRNLWLTFKNGEVVDFKADGNGTKLFKEYLEAQTGDIRRIAELGIGTNPGAKFIGQILVDEKIFGSVHIAIGNNTGAYHGKNQASDHRDFIKMMTTCEGKLYVDGKLVMKNGLPNKKL